MQEFYSLLGKPATHFLSCLLRSYLLSIVLKADSITEWCRLLKITPLYAILSGFPAGDTPGVGTFYDFFNRLWQSDKDNYVSQIKHKKAKPEKGKKTGGLKLPATRTALPQNSSPLCSGSTFQTRIRFISSSGSIKPSSWMNLSAGG